MSRGGLARRQAPGRSPDPSMLARLAAERGTPLLVVGCRKLRRQHRSLVAALPGVELFCALRPSPHAAVVATLSELGADSSRCVEAIDACREVIGDAGRRGLATLDMLDIGGGFPVACGSPTPPIAAFCRPIRRELATLPRGLRVTAGPGRCTVGHAGNGVASVVVRARREGRCWYRIDFGLYGSCSGQLSSSGARDRRPGNRPHDGGLHGRRGYRLQPDAARLDRRCQLMTGGLT